MRNGDGSLRLDYKISVKFEMMRNPMIERWKIVSWERSWWRLSLKSEAIALEIQIKIHVKKDWISPSIQVRDAMMVFHTQTAWCRFSWIGLDRIAFSLPFTAEPSDVIAIKRSITLISSHESQSFIKIYCLFSDTAATATTIAIPDRGQQQRQMSGFPLLTIFSRSGLADNLLIGSQIQSFQFD
jgi:hypothetical protein